MLGNTSIKQYSENGIQFSDVRYEEEIQSALAIKEKYSDSKIGDIVKFGKYEWYVIDKKENRLFLLATKSIGCKHYLFNVTWKDHARTNWELSDIRKWLNTEFINNSFNENEKKMLFETTIRNRDNYGTRLNYTIDKIFLLSEDEFYQYREFCKILQDKHYNWWLRTAACATNQGGDLLYRYMCLITIRRSYASNISYGSVDNSSNCIPAMWIEI